MARSPIHTRSEIAAIPNAFPVTLTADSQFQPYIAALATYNSIDRMGYVTRVSTDAHSRSVYRATNATCLL